MKATLINTLGGKVWTASNMTIAGLKRIGRFVIENTFICKNEFLYKNGKTHLKPSPSSLWAFCENVFFKKYLVKLLSATSSASYMSVEYK